MAEGEETNNDAGAAEGGATHKGGADPPASGPEAAGADPAGFEPSGVGDPAGEGGAGGAQSQRPGDWNPGEQSGGGGELY